MYSIQYNNALFCNWINLDFVPSPYYTTHKNDYDEFIQVPYKFNEK